MVYETFLELVKNSLQDYLGADFHLMLQSIQKNNGLSIEGLCIRNGQEQAAPTIHLAPFYEAFQDGQPLPGILENILSVYQDSRLPNNLNLEEFSSFSESKDKIIYRLVNETANQELLKDVPHISFHDLDLCLIFCLTIQKSEDFFLTSLIHARQLKDWNLSEEELYQTAKTNTPRLFPARIRPLPEIMKEMARNAAGEEMSGKELDEFFDCAPLSPPIYVLTNSAGTSGAACMFYEGILKDFAACLDSDLIILPSSIHEVLILPYSSSISMEELADTVFSVNLEEVPEEDRLSNHIYFYSKASDKLTVSFTSSSPIGTRNP